MGLNNNNNVMNLYSAESCKAPIYSCYKDQHTVHQTNIDTLGIDKGEMRAEVGSQGRIDDVRLTKKTHW